MSNQKIETLLHGYCAKLRVWMIAPACREYSKQARGRGQAATDRHNAGCRGCVGLDMRTPRAFDPASRQWIKSNREGAPCQE